jgi:hypothetical protein
MSPTQIGPRMELEIVKVEEGLCSGRVLYHSIIHKSPEEANVQQQEIDERERLRAERRRQQVQSVCPADVVPSALPESPLHLSCLHDFGCSEHVKSHVAFWCPEAQARSIIAHGDCAL